MAKGKVKWFDSSKGFGFIIRPEGDEVFVHYSGISAPDTSTQFKSLTEGECVEFDMYLCEKGVQAKNVRRGLG